MNRAVIISNGSIDDYSFYDGFFDSSDYIICADGGIRHCLNMNLTPDLWIGDFDSCNFEGVRKSAVQLKNVETITLSVCKDETDTHKACIVAADKGFKEIVMIGSAGTRLDHTLSNIHILEFMLKKGIDAKIINEKNTIRVFDEYVKISNNRKYISLLPLDKEVTVTKTVGLKYPLSNFDLSRAVSMGVSNEICADSAEIYIENGIMLLIESDD